MKEIKIDISDVNSAGSVEEAIHEWCRNSDEVASGVVGPSFACSGPGSGWQKNFDEADYASRALSDDHGAVAYIDVADGRVATLDDAGDVVWSDSSEVVLAVPDTDDALQYPDALMQMAVAVRDYHHAASDTAEWDTLLSRIRAAAEKIEGIEIPSAE